LNLFISEECTLKASDKKLLKNVLERLFSLESCNFEYEKKTGLLYSVKDYLSNKRELFTKIPITQSYHQLDNVFTLGHLSSYCFRIRKETIADTARLVLTYKHHNTEHETEITVQEKEIIESVSVSQGQVIKERYYFKKTESYNFQGVSCCKSFCIDLIPDNYLALLEVEVLANEHVMSLAHPAEGKLPDEIEAILSYYRISYGMRDLAAKFKKIAEKPLF
jgi:hypothetical protein